MLDRIKNILTRNFGMKIVSVIIAIILWFMINAMIDPVQVVTIKDVPVTLVNDEGLISSGQLVEIVSGSTVNIKARAKRSVAEKLGISDFKATADATAMNEFSSVAINVICPNYTDSEVEIISAKTEEGTANVVFSMEEVKAQNFAVTVINEGVVKEGYYIFSSNVSPNLITIKGSETQLSKIAKVAVIATVEGISGDVTQSCAIVAYDKDNSVVPLDKLILSEDRIKVEMHLVRTKEVAVDVSLTGTPAAGYICDTFEYAPHYITIAGDNSDLSKINSIAIKCAVSDATEDVEKVFNVSEIVKDIYGDSVRVVNESQKVSVRAIVEKEIEKTLFIPKEQVVFKELKSKYEAELMEDGISVTVKGKESLINTVTERDITANINGQHFNSEGEYSMILVNFVTPAGVKAGIVTTKVKITVSEERARSVDEPSV